LDVLEKKSRAEVVFEEYLTDQGVTWEYETLPGQRKPDYLIPHATGKCIVEVKLIADPDPRPTEGFYPGRPVLKKIQRSGEQFREYKNLPCALAVYSESMFGPYDPSVLLSAAFGPGYQQGGRDYSRLDPGPSFYRFLKRSELPKDKHFLANAKLSPVANTTFSAIIWLCWHRIRKVDLEVWKRSYAQQESGISVDNQFDLLNEIFPEYGQSLHSAETIRVITIENRHRRLPFPEDLFRGPFDQRWGWNADGWCGPVWVGNRLRELYEQEGVPFYML
jgi:hypothetical protein